MKAFLGRVLFGTLCGLASIGVYSYIKASHSKYPFCVLKNDSIYSVTPICLADVKNVDTGAEGFVPADPEVLRANEVVVSCPK